MAVGWRGYGLSVMAVGPACLVFGEFDLRQPMPEHFPARTVLAYAAGTFMVVAAAAVEWRRTSAWCAAALTVYYTLFVVILMNGRLLLADYAIFVTYEDIAMQPAIAVGGLIIYATNARIDAALAARKFARADDLGSEEFQRQWLLIIRVPRCLDDRRSVCISSRRSGSSLCCGGSIGSPTS
jgi:hypothetical protein